MAIKYHLKHINKGSDNAIIAVERKTTKRDTKDTENNEDAPTNKVREFQNKQYVSGVEACWRFRENEIAEQNLSVNRLQIHLKGEQTVYLILPTKTSQSNGSKKRAH